MLTDFVVRLTDIIFGAPEIGSNEHLRRWLDANPEKDLSQYPRLP